MLTSLNKVTSIVHLTQLLFILFQTAAGALLYLQEHSVHSILHSTGVCVMNQSDFSGMKSKKHGVYHQEKIFGELDSLLCESGLKSVT